MVDRISLNVEGMSGDQSAKVIEENVTAISGVDSVLVHLENSTVDVEFNKDVVQVKQITKTIEDRGFRVSQ